MYISSRHTIKDAYATFKSFPKKGRLILYTLLPFAILFLSGGIVGFDASRHGGEAQMNATTLVSMLLGIVGLILFIGVYYLTYIKVYEYYRSQSVFSTLKEFLTPNQSLSRLFVKAFIIPAAIMFGVFLLAVAAFGILAGLVDVAGLGEGGAAIAIGIVGFGFFGFIAWALPRITVIIPYLVAKTDKGFRDSFRFSKGHYWYLTRIMFWLALMYAGADIINSVAQAVALVMPKLMAAALILLFSMVSGFLQMLIGIFGAFVYTKAYLNISGQNPHEK